MLRLGQGIHQGVPIESYVADPAPDPSVNSGMLWALLNQSPQHAKAQHPRLNPEHEQDASARLDIGSIAHALLLEEDSSKVVVIEADDWRKKDTKEQRDAARAEGKLPILSKDYFGIQAMVTAARFQIAKSEFATDFKEAIPEQTLIWQHEGVWCRSRPDKATKDWRILFDYKTAASAHPGAFQRAMVQNGYDLQAELGMMGAEALTGTTRLTFVFLVQELDPPYAMSFISMSPAWQELAHQKVLRGLSTWKGCIRTNDWPSYTPQVAYVEPPGYASMGWDDYLLPIDAEDIV